MVNNESLVDTAQCWFKQEDMKSNPSQDPLQRDIREGSNTSEGGQGHNQQKSRSKGEGKGKRKHPGKVNHNQDQEDGQGTLRDFGLKRQRVEFVGGVPEDSGFEGRRLGRASYVFCVQKCNSVSMDPTTAEFVEESSMGMRSERALMETSKSQRERYFSPLDVEMTDQRSTLEVL